MLRSLVRLPALVRSKKVVRIQPMSSQAVGRTIDAANARKLLDSDEAKFIDVRAPERYSEAHIPRAANIHEFFTYLATSDARGVQDLTDTFVSALQCAGINGTEGEHVITYEDSLQALFGASCRAFYLLKLLGHPRVSVLDGGFETWTQGGHPTTQDVEHVSKGTFKPAWNAVMWRGKEDVADALKRRGTVLLDVRDLDEWKGESSSPYGVDFAPRKGRIPGATHILWKDFMETGASSIPAFKKPEEIHKLCAAKGITPDKEIVLYCFKGARASNTYLALKEAGFENVSNYFASWNEWSRDDKLVVDSEVL